MFRSRRRRKLTAEESEYINRRYEDPAVRIYLEVKRERYLYSSYVPWIQAMLIQYIPDSVLRDKYWMEQVPLLAERTEQAATGWSKERKERRLKWPTAAKQNKTKKDKRGTKRSKWVRSSNGYSRVRRGNGRTGG